VKRELLVVFAFAIAAHAASIPNDFAYDDYSAITRNRSVTGPLSVEHVLRRDFWGRSTSDPAAVGTWRPLTTLTFWMSWHMGGGRPWVFHATNVLLHALTSLLFALAVALATGDRWLSVVAGSIYAILAVNSEAVASIVGRADVLAAGFGFLAWALWQRQIWAAAVAYLAACLCKESAIILPLWLFALEALLRPDALRTRRWAWLVLAVTGVGVVALRAVCFARVSTVFIGAGNNPLLGTSFFVRLWTGMRLLVIALRTILVPLNTAADYSASDIPPDRAFAWEPLLGALTLLMLATFVVRFRRRAPVPAAGTAFFLLTWLVVSNLVVVLPTIFAERLLYLPAAGFAMVLGYAVKAAWQKRRSLGLVFLCALAAENLVFAVVADRIWHDDLSLFANTVEVSPRSPKAWLNYAVALRGVGELDRAEFAFLQSLRWGPTPKALTGLGTVVDQLGRQTEAEKYLRRAIQEAPDDQDCVDNAAVFYSRHHLWSDAARVLSPYLARHPDDTHLADMLHAVERAQQQTP
jgi:tetratricopeptide (TPR) repeat protein